MQTISSGARWLAEACPYEPGLGMEPGGGGSPTKAKRGIPLASTNIPGYVVKNILPHAAVATALRYPERLAGDY